MADRSCWGDFEVQRELGRGTWGTVVLARRRQDGACYALKIVQLDKRSHKDQLAAVQECQLLASLDSPHITRYYDSFLHDGRLVIVMEWAPGGSLHAAIGRSARPLPEEGIWRVLLHITLALHHMHSRRMLHRDVKSLNVFLTGPLDSQGWHTQCKLGDVGVSKVLEEGKSHASTLIGTPFYLSPEICQEKPYDAKSDMWALGVVLYECATRRHPFDAQSQPSLILKILRGRYEPVLGLSSDLTAIINRCLSQSAARRPSAERLLSLPVVRAKAVELGIELPSGLMAAVTASPSGSFSLGEGNVKGSPGSARVSIDLRAGARLERVPGRRATCPHGAPPAPAAAAPAPRRNVVGRRSTPHEGLEGRRISVNGAAMERRKPPLPAAAVPTRRQTEQPRSKLSLINSLQGAPSVQLQRMSLAPTPAASLAEASALQPLADQYMPVPAETGSPQTELSSFGSSPTTTGTIPAAVGQAGQHQISPRRQSHFSVLHHMQALSGAAHQWLAQRSDSEGRASGGACGGPFPAVSAVAAAALVERSVKSDSSLLPPRRLAEQAEAVSPPVALAAMPSEREEEEEEKQAMLRALRKRCVALLGSEELFEELHGLAQPAAEGGGGDGAAPRPTTLAALGDALFARVGYSGNAAEGLHLLMRILAMDAAAGPLGQWTAGVAVAYGGPSDGQDPHVAYGGVKSGSCGYGELSPSEWPYWSAIAIGPTHPLALNASRHPLLGCGACLELQCDSSQPGFQSACPPGASSTSLIALVTDKCTDCILTGANKITLHYLTFQQKLANPDIGEVAIRWRQVECNSPSSIVADVDTYRATEGGYMRLALESVAGTGGIQSVELRQTPVAGDRLSLVGTAWTKLRNVFGALWEGSGLPDPPLDLRITADTSEAVLAREAIKLAGATGRVVLGVQFSTAETPGIADALTTSAIVPSGEDSCNVTVTTLLRARPDMGVLLHYLETARILPLLDDPTAHITLFAPTDDAWSQVSAAVDLSDTETLQQVLTFLVAHGQVVIPDTSHMLPEDLAGGGIKITVDTLNGEPLHVLAGPDGIVLQDGSNLTPDAIVVSANNMACQSVVNVVKAAVPMPF